MTLTFTDDEQTLLEAIRHAGGFRTEVDAVKGALWWYGRFLDLEPHPDLFALGETPVPQEPDASQGDLFGAPV
jgi:hypothetical protein